MMHGPIHNKNTSYLHIILLRSYKSWINFRNCKEEQALGTLNDVCFKRYLFQRKCVQHVQRKVTEIFSQEIWIIMGTVTKVI